MKLFVYGEFGPMAMEQSFLPTLQNAPEVEEVIPIERLDLPREQQIFERGLRRFWPALSIEIKEHNAHVLNLIESIHTGASALLVFKGMELFPSTLKRIKERGVALFCYNPDHPFVYSGSGSGSKFMAQSIGLFDRYFTYHKEAQKMLSEQGNVSVLIPFGYEKMAMAESFVNAEDEVLRGCFIGNANSLRVKLFEQLSGHVPFDLYGNGWSRYLSRFTDVQVHSPVVEAEHWAAMARYRFQFNAMALHNVTSHNMRSFAAPASGAIMLAPRNADHERFFKDGEEVMLFDDAQDCIRIAKELLELPYHEALQIRKAAKDRSINSGYAYTARAEELLRCMLDAVN